MRRLLHTLRDRLRGRADGDRRKPVRMAMHDLTVSFLDQRTEAVNPRAAARELYRLREQLCTPKPDPAEVDRRIRGFVDLVEANPTLTAKARKLDNAVKGWLSST